MKTIHATVKMNNSFYNQDDEFFDLSDNVSDSEIDVLVTQWAIDKITVEWEKVEAEDKTIMLTNSEIEELIYGLHSYTANRISRSLISRLDQLLPEEKEG